MHILLNKMYLTKNTFTTLHIEYIIFLQYLYGLFSYLAASFKTKSLICYN